MNSMQAHKHIHSAAQNSFKNYNTLIEFAKFLKENGDKLFEKDSKLCLQIEQLLILQDYLENINPKTNSAGPRNDDGKQRRKNSTLLNTKEFIALYKSNQLHLIQDFLYKITNLKIIAETQLNAAKDLIKLDIFGSLTYLEIKNCPIINIHNMQNLRNQLEILICTKSISKIQDLLHLCGADHSMPLTWPKLHTLNLSHNSLSALDSSFRLAVNLEILDLSHNNLRDCGDLFHVTQHLIEYQPAFLYRFNSFNFFALKSLKKLKKLNLSFNKFESLPSLCAINNVSTVEHLDLSYNNIDKVQIENISKLGLCKSLNLKNNLISELVEINHLRLLSSITNISIQRNPVELNPTCNFIIEEILAVVSLKTNLKSSPQNVRLNSSNPISSGSSAVNGRSANLNIISKQQQQQQQPKVNETRNRTTTLLSAPHMNATLARKDTRSDLTKKRIKPNFISIEPDQDDESSDYFVVNSDKAHLNESMRFSISQGTDYDPSKLQKEIENLKKMRQNYGTEWLLSAPTLATAQPVASTSLNFKSTLNDSYQLKEETENELSKENANSSTDLKQLMKTCSIIESFPVYRSVQSHSGECDQAQVLSILSLNEKYLIEKDETNQLVLFSAEYAQLDDIQFKPEYVLLVSFKNNTSKRLYTFENEQELSSFIECIQVILLNEVNLFNCDIFYCMWCNEFGKKSKFVLKNQDTDDESTVEDDHSNTLTCTKCNKFLIKDGLLQGIRSGHLNNQHNLSEDSFQSDVERKDLKSSTPQNDNETAQTVAASLRSNFTLNEVLKNFKKQAEQNEQQQQQQQQEHKQAEMQHSQQNEIENTLEKVDLNGTLSSNENTYNQNDSNEKTTDEEAIDEIKIKLKQLLKNNQITKSKLDEISNEAKRINNNLKLYLIINELSEEQNSMPPSKSKSKQETNKQAAEQVEEETLVCAFRLTHLIVNKSTLYENVLCVLTNKNLLLFRILNEELFKQQMEFEKCIKREFTIEINRIEIIEVALGQHYLVLDTVIAQKNEDSRNTYKLVTCDVYKTQAFLSILSKMINECKKFTLLKQIKKKNESTNRNLAKLLSVVENSSTEAASLAINCFSLIDHAKIDDKDESNSSSKLFFIYNEEKLMLIEENLLYGQTATLNNDNDKQFDFVDSIRISDIVHLRLFKEIERRVEISIVDESNNSKQITWTLDFNKEFLLSQFISQLKTCWEQLFFIELPINF